MPARASRTASRSPARPRPGSTSTGRPARAGPSPTATCGFASTASSATPRRRGELLRRRGELLATVCYEACAAVRRPVVVKLGSSLVASPGGRARRSLVRDRCREIAKLVRGGTPVCVVSSGAIALGLPRLGLSTRPRSLPRLQAASALGQTRLQALWDEALGREGLPAAQVLLAATDVADRAAYLNVRNALAALFALGAVPVVNENDTTATDEITFGDNDALAAQVAILVRARLLVLLTEVEGVYTRAPGT